MRRRDILKALATVPFASALGNCLQNRPAQPAASKEKKIHALQILLEGPFAVVLQNNKPNRLVAFVQEPSKTNLTLPMISFSMIRRLRSQR